MCEYIIKKSGRLELLGKDNDDQFVVDNFMWGKDLINCLLALIVENKNNQQKLIQ